MTNDKALEAAYAVAGNACKTCQGGDACNGFECRIAFEAAISAYFSALPGEAEVVAWQRRLANCAQAVNGRKVGEWGEWEQCTVEQAMFAERWGGVEGFPPYLLAEVRPLVTLASYQAMQARAETAERERDEAKQAVDAFSDICVELGVERDNEAGLQAAHDLKARVKEMEEALKLAKATIKVWHGPNAWDIYDRASPEMATINTALTGGSNG